MNELEQPKGKEAAPAIERVGDIVPPDFSSLWGETISLAPVERNKPTSERYSIGDDGLIVENVGAWVKTKHKIVTDYVQASGPARRKYHSAAFIEVFSGPGRAKIRDTNEYVEGSAVAAFKAGRRYASGFSSIEISDAEDDYLGAARQRLAKIDAPIRTAKGPAKNAIKEIVGRIDPYGLHFSLLDPHNLGSLSFSIFEELAKLKHVDVLVHVSISDMQRNADRYTSDDYDQFDEFSPGWRERVGSDMNKQALRSAIVKDWSDRVEQLGLPRAEHCELMTGDQSQRLYWLIFLSRHPLAHKLWSAISSEAKSPSLPF